MPESLPNDFIEFWSAYPRKVGKLDALKAWKKEQPDLARVLEVLAWQVQQPQWQDLTYVPHPGRWIRRGSWLDEPIKPSNRPVVDWFEDCKARHGGTCSGRYQHGMRD